MTFGKKTVLVCLLAGLISPLGSQENKKAALPGHAAAAKLVSVDLCALARQLDAGEKRIRLDGLKKNYLLADHDETTLRYENKDQIVWTCKDNSFEIVTIERVWNHGCPKDQSIPASPPPFPFAPPVNYFGVSQEKGHLLYSGPPVKAAIGQRFKYTFMVGDHKYDPHVIVTGGSEGNRPMPCPHPDPSPTPAKPGVKSKQ